MWQGGERGEPELLSRCYRNSLALAHQHGVTSIAFPSISTGAYGYPLHAAARIALREIDAFLAGDTQMAQVLVVCFDERARAAHAEARRELGI